METKSQKEDYRRYFVERGDEGFSPRRNAAVIARTIKKTDAMRAARAKAYAEGVRERTSAVTDYLLSPKSDSMSIDRYFGKRTLARLRGESIVTKLKQHGLMGGLTSAIK